MPAPIPIAIRAAVIADYARGSSSLQVAARHGVSDSSVIAWSRAAGVQIRRQGAPLPQSAIVRDGRWVQNARGIKVWVSA